jgi:UDP-N-acetylmuramoylalanine--D-glutamate ligase
MEPVRELDGVSYIDDSKGTNVDATAKALTSFSEPVILLAGGRGKGTGYRKLREIVSKKVKHLVLIGEEADKMEKDLEGCAEIHRAADMAEAVERARDLAEPGQAVLLSPACASFDMFKDYAHRGEVFAELVRGLEEQD